ncbi:Sulfotransferase [Trinorchestia longiramus]|nr:Sulfotransferase [Trinorchestia longiramus]
MILTNKTRALSPSEIPSHVPHVSRSLRSLADSSFSSDDVRVRLSRYTKFLFVRHPMERLVSAFRNKFEKETQFSRSIGPEILRKFRKHHSGTPHANVTFSEFVRYLVDKKFRRKESLNEHWEAYTELCLPCIVPYDYIGKYETLKEDSDRILEEIGAPEGLQFPPFVPSATASLVPRYLSTLLPSEQRLATDVYKADFLLFQYDFPIVRNKSIS